MARPHSMLTPLMVGLALAAPARAQDFRDGPPAAGQQPAFAGQTRAPAAPGHSAYATATVARGLVHPWSLTWLPDGRMLVTERPGRLRIVGPGGRLSPPVRGVPSVADQDQGGLLDVALDPTFGSNRLVYLSYLEPRVGGLTGIAVARGALRETGGPARLEGLSVILRTQPAGRDGVNVGSRLAFGRDGKLYVSVGDRMALRDHAQRLDSDLGKILRINPDGSIPPDNPFVGRPGRKAKFSPWAIAIQRGWR